MNGEERDEQPKSDRDNCAREARRGDSEALDGGEHADCGRDHAVADQEPRAKHQRPKQHADTAVLAIMQQAVERKYAALAVVLRPQHEEGVFDRDDEGQGPDHERDGADCVLGRAGRRNAENLVHGIKGRSADVAMDDPERAQRKRPDAACMEHGPAPPLDGESGAEASAAGSSSGL